MNVLLHDILLTRRPPNFIMIFLIQSARAEMCEVKVEKTFVPKLSARC